MQLEWKTDWEASCYYAASRLAACSGEPATPLGKSLRQPAADLASTLQAATGNAARAFELLPMLALHSEGAKRTAESVLVRMAGRSAARGAAVSRIASSLLALQQAAQDAAPNLAEQLPHRVRPLREAWEAYGPGLLQQMARRTDDRLFVEQALIVVAEPLEGGGQPYLDFNTVIVEGVLAHPHADLPETLRLAWMLSQLNNDLPTFSELIPGPRLQAVSQLAMIPAAIEAGAALQLCRDDPSTWKKAIDVWISTPPEGGLESLTAWWRTLLESDADWRTALTGLDQLLMLE